MILSSATKEGHILNKISGNQLRQMNKRNRRFDDHLGLH